MTNNLVVLMLDGISADYFATHRHRMPNVAALAERGFTIDNLHSEVPGTSLPGRTSMITGHKAAQNGVWGNTIWDGERFRYAAPYDVRVPTVPQLAKQAGKRVAVIGFGMVRPQDVDMFLLPWWAGAFIQRGRDPQPVHAGAGWLKVLENYTPSAEMFATLEAMGLHTTTPMLNEVQESKKALFGVVGDQYQMNAAGAIAASALAVDFTISEVVCTDMLQHDYGYKSEMAHWSMTYVDGLVGQVVERLKAAGKWETTNLAVMSDHGHSVIESALHPHVIIPGVTFAPEGSMLYVRHKDADELAMVAERLAAYGCERYPSTFIVPEYQEQIAVFLAPDRVSFEHDEANLPTEPTGRPKAISSHGIRPGAPGDDRFCVFVGPDVPQGRLDAADAWQVAPTFAALLGLPLEAFPAAPVFDLVAER
jgi:predicted AlkP superfamily pyrophosphatase or phosphodiesterase